MSEFMTISSDIDKTLNLLGFGIVFSRHIEEYCDTQV